jgi:hypothetical protein
MTVEQSGCEAPTNQLIQPLQFAVSTSPIGRAFNAASVAAPKEQPPRNLSGKRTAREGNAGKKPVHDRLAEGEIRRAQSGGEALRYR